MSDPRKHFIHLHTIVIVTPDPDSVAGLVKELQAKMVEVNVVKDANRAVNIEALKPNQWKPSMFLSDLCLTKGSGFILTSRLLDKYPDKKTPVILMSNQPQHEDHLEAQQVGAVALLAKPVTLNDLVGALDKERARRIRIEEGELNFKISTGT